MSKQNILNIKTFNKDKRKPINKLYNSYSKLDKNWSKEVVTVFKDNNIELPILCFSTKHKGNSLYLISGIHGEEPAGPNAISNNIKFLNKLARKIHIVLLPLCNPIGYKKNQRYPDLKNSIGDSEHFLLDLKNKKPRRTKPVSENSLKFTSYLIKKSKSYKPILVLDLHEDEKINANYIYSQGELGKKDPVAIEISKFLNKKNLGSAKKIKTRFNEIIENNIISNVNDGSIDELLSSKRIINKKIKKGPNAKSVIVFETMTKNIPLKKRVKIHSEIIRNLGKYLSMIKS
ncbi:succinylglutamate desuccinylase/aspartoacylase family protein [Candidatus Pacearchaeota archaeon]|nr:succinylglutamate desuccinylase/aspartoacylase family protein [Candidatus Pacearchaeota archaeon]